MHEVIDWNSKWIFVSLLHVLSRGYRAAPIPYAQNAILNPARTYVSTTTLLDVQPTKHLSLSGNNPLLMTDKLNQQGTGISMLFRVYTVVHDCQ